MSGLSEVTASQLDEMTWSSFDDDVLRQKVYWLGPFRAATHICNHGVEVFTKKKKYNNKKVLTVHSISISCGPYGETGFSHTLPVNTSIATAKARAVEMAKEAIAAGHGLIK